MRIKTHHSLSLDGFSATADGLPAITQVTEFKPKETHGIPEFTATTSAVAMGRTTFEPAIGNPWWPWPGRRVYVVSSRELPAGTPEDVVHVTGGVDGLLERLRADEPDADVELLGGPMLIRAAWERGAIDQLGLLVLPVLFGEGLPLFPLGRGASRCGWSSGPSTRTARSSCSTSAPSRDTVRRALTRRDARTYVGRSRLAESERMRLAAVLGTVDAPCSQGSDLRLGRRGGALRAGLPVRGHDHRSQFNPA